MKFSAVMPVHKSNEELGADRQARKYVPGFTQEAKSLLGGASASSAFHHPSGKLVQSKTNR